MRRVVVCMLAICCLAGQAWADMSYILDSATAAKFQQVSLSSGDRGYLSLVIGHDDTIYWEDTATSPGVYDETMLGQVGFVGSLTDHNKDGTASMQIGTAITPGSYTGFGAYVANDNQSTWQYRLYVSDGTTTLRSGWTTLLEDTSAWLEFTFESMTVSALGFEIGANYSLPDAPSRTDTFHTSLVPTPMAVLLGMLGLGVAGLKLRKFV